MFPGSPGLVGTMMSLFWILLELRMIEILVATGVIGRANRQSSLRHQHARTLLFTRRMPALPVIYPQMSER